MAKFTFPVEASHILMFARSLGEQNPAFIGANDGGELGELTAPPTFVQAAAQFDPDFHLRPKPGATWFGSAREPGGQAGEAPSSGNLHAEQHFEFLRPIRAGDVLSVEKREGAQWEKPSRRGGVLKFSESFSEYRDLSGALVCVSRTVVINTQDVTGK